MSRKGLAITPMKLCRHLVLSVAVVIVGLRLFSMAKQSLSAGVVSDQQLYFAMARGLLNGLSMWSDLFETKPPVIYWISELSLLFGGDATLYRVLLLTGIGGMIAVINYTHKDRWFTLLFSLFLGCYVLLRGDGFQTEIFAVFPVAVGMYAYRKKYDKLSAFCLAFLILLKEPFALTYLCALTLLHPSCKRLVKIAGLGGALAVLTLVVTGNIENYLHIYLPEMLSVRVGTTVSYHDFRDDTFHVAAASAFLRGLQFQKLFIDLFFNNPWAMGIAIAIFCVTILQRSFVGLGSILYAANTLFILEQISVLMGAIPIDSSFFQWKLIESLFLISLALGLGTRKMFLVAFALYCVNFAMGIGGFFPQHALFGVPIWIALFMLFEITRASLYKTTLTWFLVFCMTANAILMVDNYNFQSPHFKKTIREKAALIDAVLTRCNVQRYMTLSRQLEDVQAWTTHSPFELAYGLRRAGEPNPGRFEEKMQEDWQNASVVVKLEGVEATLPTDFSERFTLIPPACAKGIAPIQGIQIFFRKGFQ